MDLGCPSSGFVDGAVLPDPEFGEEVGVNGEEAFLVELVDGDWSQVLAGDVRVCLLESGPGVLVFESEIDYWHAADGGLFEFAHCLFHFFVNFLHEGLEAGDFGHGPLPGFPFIFELVQGDLC